MRVEEKVLKEFIEKVRRENHDLLPINEEHQIQFFKCLIELTIQESKKG